MSDYNNDMQHTAQQMTEAGKSAMETGMQKMTEFTKMFSDMKMPAMLDMESVMAAHRKNMEVLSAANRVALEGAQHRGQAAHGNPAIDDAGHDRDDEGDWRRPRRRRRRRPSRPN